MLRIHNIEKLEGAKLDKRNMIVSKVVPVTVHNGSDVYDYYEFRLINSNGAVRVVRLDRECELWNDGKPVYRLYNFDDPSRKVTLHINALKNKDILIDKLRFVGIN